MCRQHFYWFPSKDESILKSQIDQYITDEKPEEKEEYEIRVQRGEMLQLQEGTVNLTNRFMDELDAAKMINQLCEEYGIPRENPEIDAIPNQKRRMNTSQYTGVGWSRQNKKWKVTISVNGHRRYGGHFKDELDAAKRVNQLCEQLGIPRKNPGIDTIPNQQQQNMNLFDYFCDEGCRRINDFMLDTITQHGSLTQQASDDVQTAFGLSSNQTQQVYDHLQENMNWFHYLDERRALGATTMMKEAIQRFGGFNEQVIAEMQTHFRFTSVQSRQLYEHLNTQPELSEIEFINITFDSVDDIDTIKTNNDQNYDTESGEEEEEEEEKKEDGIQKIVDTNNKRKRKHNSKK